MEELQISGRRYISSRRVAKEHGYHTDYIGQLIRGGKIVGQKVGRAWYVDAESFDAYLGKEGAAMPEPVAKTAAKQPIIEVVKEEIVKPVVEVLAEKEDEAIEEKEEEVEEVKEEVEDAPETIEEAVNQVAEEAETKQEEAEKIEEEKVAEAAEDDAEPIAVHLQKEEVSAPAARTGLRYYTDDAPLLPEIPNKKNASRISADDESAAEMGETEVFATQPAVVRAPMRGRHVASLMALGMVALVAGALVSSAVTLNMTISEGNTASVSYGVDWSYSASFIDAVK